MNKIINTTSEQLEFDVGTRVYALSQDNSDANQEVFSPATITKIRGAKAVLVFDHALSVGGCYRSIGEVHHMTLTSGSLINIGELIYSVKDMVRFRSFGDIRYRMTRDGLDYTFSRSRAEGHIK